MPLRMLDYVVQIFRGQERGRKQESSDELLDPVLPIVLYTGTKRWDSIGSMTDLIAAGGLFEEFTPGMRPLFVNLPAIAPERLESEDGGAFGRVLRLVRKSPRHARSSRTPTGPSTSRWSTSSRRCSTAWTSTCGR
jgi:hypothetical protein